MNKSTLLSAIAISIGLGSVTFSLIANREIFLIAGLSILEIVTILAMGLKSRNWKTLGVISALVLPSAWLMNLPIESRLIWMIINVIVFFAVIILGWDDDGPSPLRRLRLSQPPKLVPVANR